MAGLEEQLSAVLSNPQMMQQIMAMAQNFAPPPEAPPQPQPPPPPQAQIPPLPNIDPAMLQKLSGLMNAGGIDQNQQQLLQALCPYISNYRITKLEKAMQAAKMAKMATSLLGNFGQGR